MSVFAHCCPYCDSENDYPEDYSYTVSSEKGNIRECLREDIECPLCGNEYCVEWTETITGLVTTKYELKEADNA